MVSDDHNCHKSRRLAETIRDRDAEIKRLCGGNDRTHYAGCPCHEARRDAEISNLKEQLSGSVHSCNQGVIDELSRQLANAKAGLTCGEHPGMSCPEAHADERARVCDHLDGPYRRLLKENEEQARLLGMSANRDAKWLADFEALKKQLDAERKAADALADAVDLYNKLPDDMDSWIEVLDALAAYRSESDTPQRSEATRSHKEEGGAA